MVTCAAYFRSIGPGEFDMNQIYRSIAVRHISICDRYHRYASQYVIGLYPLAISKHAKYYILTDMNNEQYYAAYPFDMW